MLLGIVPKYIDDLPVPIVERCVDGRAAMGVDEYRRRAARDLEFPSKSVFNRFFFSYGNEFRRRTSDVVFILLLIDRHISRA